MKTFIDESGCFSWTRSGKSIFCGVSLPDPALPTLFLRFFHWKRDVLGLKRQKEIKACDLDTKQLRSFVERVALPEETFRLTYTAVDTQFTSAAIVDKMRDQWADVLAVVANREDARGNRPAAQFHLEMSNWVRRRSHEHFLWNMALYAIIFESVQNTISRFAHESFDAEFASWDIIIDRSFIKRDRHMTFWQEWLRHQLMQFSVNHGGFKAPSAWLNRNHPLLKNMRSDINMVDGSELLLRHTYFANSQPSEGLQLADMCAHICFRYFRNGVTYEPLTLLRERINDGSGGPIRLIHLSEDHIWKDSAEAHVYEMTPEQFLVAHGGSESRGKDGISDASV
ncbi:MAG: DUF3800 domain-containing protein [Terriglobales bacterium]